MSETFFHLLGPGTQPNDDSFSMNPLPITCQVNDEPSMAALEQCAHSPQVIALLNASGACVSQSSRRDSLTGVQPRASIRCHNASNGVSLLIPAPPVSSGTGASERLRNFPSTDSHN